MITESVSNTGIKAIITSNNGIFRYNAIADITPPRNKVPVSPINTFALELLRISAEVVETPNFFDFYLKKIYNLDKTTQRKMGGTYG